MLVRRHRFRWKYSDTLGILFSVLAHNIDELREFESHTLAAMCGSIFQVCVAVEV